MDTTPAPDSRTRQLASVEAVLQATRVATAAALDATKLAAEVAAKTQGRLSTQAVVQLVVWLVTVMLAYSAITSRLSVLEVRYDLTAQTITELRQDVKELLSRSSK